MKSPSRKATGIRDLQYFVVLVEKYEVAHVQFASKYRNCTCPSFFVLPPCITIHAKFSIVAILMYIYSHQRLQHFDTVARICVIALFRDRNPENSCTFLTVLLILYMNPGGFSGFSVDVYLLMRRLTYLL